jgi:murein DD-endopeptidase MepM/ murein hydrolase activator NlpD
MRALRSLAWIGFAAGVAAAPTASAQNRPSDIQTAADAFVAAYNAREYEAIVRRLAPAARVQVTLEALRRFYDGLHDSAGKLTSLGKPALFGDGIAVYPANFERKAMELAIALDDSGMVRGLEINDKPSRHVRNRTPLTLPFKGDWLVIWGGDTPEQNYHQSIALARFAFDFTKVDARGRKFKGDGTRADDYFSFGQEIIAPADGVVTDVITGVADNVPGTVNNFADMGNTVMIRHETGEVSVFGHLEFGSTRVSVGQRVTRGQVLGLCGNSGNSDEPHLHYQLQDSNVPTRESTIKVFFQNLIIRRDSIGSAPSEYSPVKGDIVRQAAPRRHSYVRNRAGPL